MNKFINNSLIFICIIAIIILFSLFFIPNKKINENSLFANIDKHKRLDSLPSPKIILIGGSNFAYGINSKMIEENTHYPVVNMGLHAGFGLMYTINEVKDNIRKGDIVVLSPVYQWLKSGNEMLYGEEVLIALLFDVNRSDLRYLNVEQGIYLLPNTVSYAVSKLVPRKLDVMGEGADWYEKIYLRTAFNKYGDESQHWKYPKQSISIGISEDNSDISLKSVETVRKFRLYVEKQGARFIMIPPSLINYNTIRPFANKLSAILKQNKTPFAIEPDSCVLDSSLFFNTAYHLNKRGVEIYTRILIDKILE